METSLTMRLTIAQRIEEALSQEAPIESIRQLAITLNTEGIGKEEILREFYVFDEILRNANRDQDVDYLEDVIDMMTGCYTRG